MTLKNRILVLLLFVSYFLVTYKGIQYLTLAYLTPHAMNLPGEDSIPFVPWMIWVYMLVYVVPAVVLLIPPNKGQVLKMTGVFFVASVIHYFFFLALPVRYNFRPSPEVYAHHPIVAFIYLIDEPLNCFPSIHVSFVFLSYFFVQRYKPRLAWVMLVIALLISLSTVLVKQHYIVDVVAAIILSVGLNEALIKRRFPIA